MCFLRVLLSLFLVAVTAAASSLLMPACSSGDDCNDDMILLQKTGARILREPNPEDLLEEDADEGADEELHVHRAKQVNHDKDSFTLGSTGTTTTDQVKWHSQKGQDEWVFEMLGQKHGGFFIDLAVNKPVLYSNTISLEEQYDWKGICIDANPEYVRRCKEKRSCIVLQAAVDCVSGRDVEFAMRDELGGVIDENADNKPGTQTDEKLVHFKTRTLANLLEATGAPKIIDYLSLDIEGFEYRALVAFPFDKYRFRALTIERPPPWLNAVLLKNGYVWMRNKLFDSFYVHYSEVAALQAAQRHNLTEVEQVPSKCDGKAGTSCEWSSEAPELPFCTGK